MSTHRQGVRIFGITFGQSSQMGQSRTNESSFLADPLELSSGPRRFQTRAPVNAEAGSSRLAQRTQLLDSEPGESRLLDFDLNELPSLDSNEPRGGPTSSSARDPVEPSPRPLWSIASWPSNNIDDQVGQPAILHSPVNLVDQSLQSHGFPPHGPIEVVDLVSEDEEEDNDDDVDDDEDDEEEDDDGYVSAGDDDDEDDDDEAAAGDDDVILSPPIASGQAISYRRRALRMRASNDPELVMETSARNQRRRVDPGPSNSNLEVAPTPPSPPPRRPPTFDCPICYESYAEGTTTRCGHMFCNDCLRSAMLAQGRCPTCREMINPRGLIRFNLPDPL